MKRILKYLIPLIVAVACFETDCWSDISSYDKVTQDYSLEAAKYSSYISETDSDICLPRQVSPANTISVQHCAKRPLSLQRQNVEFVKSGKVIKPDIRYFQQLSSISTHSSLTDPAHNLTRLGKLII